MINILILDYGMGNLRSVQKAFDRNNVNAVISKSPNDIRTADKIILPGVGHFQKGMNNLETSGLVNSIKEAVLVKKTPMLGICLGMQLMTNFSEEGNVEGLGIINAEVKRFSDGSLKIPHMGWNTLIESKYSSVFHKLDREESVYFTHSYYVTCLERSDVLYQTNYGICFDSAFERDNLFGFQFHPEKSHKTGLKLLEKFAKL